MSEVVFYGKSEKYVDEMKYNLNTWMRNSEKMWVVSKNKNKVNLVEQILKENRAILMEQIGYILWKIGKYLYEMKS